MNGSTLDYNALNNKPITLVPTTTNLQLTSGFNFLVDRSIISTNTLTGTNDILNMRYYTRNGIRFTQTFIGTDNVRYDLIERDANVDRTSSLTFYNGNVGIGTTNPANILQVGSGGRLRIANNTSDQTVIGGDDVASSTSSRIELKGST